MLTAMRIQALDYLFRYFNENATPPDDLEKWYCQLRKNSPEKLIFVLTESVEQTEHVYIIEKQANKTYARLSVEDMRPEIQEALPFIKPTGSQSAQIGPVIKRSYDKTRGAGPSAKILNTTMKHFETLASANRPWSSYFADVLSVLTVPEIQLPDGSICNWKDQGYHSMLECVVNAIGAIKNKALVAVKNSLVQLPGQASPYQDYIMTEVLAGDRYLTAKIKAIPDSECPLCGNVGTTIYPNALKGAGINLTNVDRAGRFPGMHIANAWKGFSVCADCADLLYIYKNHVLRKRGPKKNIRPFTAPIAGDTALVIPACTTDPSQRFEIWQCVGDYIHSTLKGDLEIEEETLLDILRQQKGLFNLTFLWCVIGQSIENVSGVITDVPPSRLNWLSDFNEEQARIWRHPIFPRALLNDSKHNLEIDLNLAGLKSLFHRPGGKKAPNATRRLSEIKRLLAEAVYHGKTFSVKNQKRLWDEIVITAQWWWRDAVERGETYGLLNPGKGKNGPYLTAAGWVRHWAWWLYYFKKMGVLQMENKFYEPQWDELNAYMGRESGINNQAKAFAFLLGVIYGRLIFIQENAGFRVSVLTWVKRFTIDGHDLPELYKKVQAKLLEYRQVPDEKSKKMFTKNFQKVVEESAFLGARLGDRIELNSNLTCYYLLLGLSLSNKIIKKKGE